MHAICDAACQPHADHAECRRALLREKPRGHARRRAGAELPELVGLDHRLEPRFLEREEHDDERCAHGCPRVRLQPRVPELAVDARHHRELAVVERQPFARPVVDRAARLPVERLLDGRERVGGREQLGDLGLAQVERHAGTLVVDDDAITLDAHDRRPRDLVVARVRT